MKFKVVNNPYIKKNWDSIYSNNINVKCDNLLMNIDNTLINEQKNLYTLLINQKKKYKKEHNEFLYFLNCFLLPFGFLFFVFPGIYLFKKIKKINNKKKELLEELGKKEKDVLIINKNIIDSINFDKMVSETLEQELGYFNFGYITDDLIENIKTLTSINIINDENNSTLNTSWGFFNNNIVINTNLLSHNVYIKKYTGSKSVSYTVDGETYYDIVNATFEWPCVEFIKKRNLWCFSEYAQELEFSFSQYYTGKFFNKKSNKNLVKFENEEFEEHYHWNYNDEGLIRMIFTPYFQEQYLSINNNGEPKDCFKIKKCSTFFSSERNCDDLNIFNQWSINNFLTNPYYKIDDFKNKLKESLISYFYNWYESLSFMTIIPLLQSEDQRFLLNKIDVSKHNTNIFFIQYIINDVLNEKLISKNTETIHVVKKIKTHNNKLLEVDITAYSYEIHDRVKYISEYSYKANRNISVPVPYVDFIKHEVNGKLFILRVDSKINYDKNTFDNEVKCKIDEIIKITNSNNVIIKNGYICLMTKNIIKVDKLIAFINNLKTLIENKNP